MFEGSAFPERRTRISINCASTRPASIAVEPARRLTNTITGIIPLAAADAHVTLVCILKLMFHFSRASGDGLDCFVPLMAHWISLSVNI